MPIGRPSGCCITCILASRPHLLLPHRGRMPSLGVCLGTPLWAFFVAWVSVSIVINGSRYSFSFKTTLRWCSSACMFSP